MSEQSLIDTALEGEDLSSYSPLERLMIENAKRRERFEKEQALRVQRVGELHTRIIFLKAAGSIPPHLQEVVQSVLLPADPVVKEPSNG